MFLFFPHSPLCQTMRTPHSPAGCRLVRPDIDGGQGPKTYHTPAPVYNFVFIPITSVYFAAFPYVSILFSKNFPALLV